MAARQSSSRDLTEPAVRRRTTTSPHTPIVPQASDQSPADVAADEAAPVKQDTREALQSLLDRGARVPARDNAVKASALSEAALPAAPAMSVEGTPAGDTPAPAAAPDMPDPKLDQMFREIFDSRTAPSQPSAPPAASASRAPSEAPVDERPAPQPDANSGANSEADKKRTLLDRLRVMHERQTG